MSALLVFDSITSDLYISALEGIRLRAYEADVLKAQYADPHHEIRADTVAAEADDLIVDRQQPARIADHDLAMRGQADALHRTVEDILAEKILQPLDLRADRRLRHAERHRRLGEAAAVNDRHKSAQ